MLFRSIIDRCRRDVSFPSLKALSLLSVGFRDGSHAILLSPSTIPSLTSLSLHGCHLEQGRSLVDRTSLPSSALALIAPQITHLAHSLRHTRAPQLSPSVEDFPALTTLTLSAAHRVVLEALSPNCTIRLLRLDILFAQEVRGGARTSNGLVPEPGSGGPDPGGSREARRERTRGAAYVL